MTPADLDKLDALVKATTPGVWIDMGDIEPYPGCIVAAEGEHGRLAVVLRDAEMDDRPADRACTAALHNAAPALIAAARDLAWHEERHGTRAEQEALDAALAVDIARIDALSDEECEAELAAEGIDYDAARKKIDVTLKLCAERADLKREVERLRDLVRHQRGPLFDADLITKAEYAALVGDAGAVARLEGYDVARAEADRLRATVDAQTAIIVDLKAEKAGLELDVERLRKMAPRWVLHRYSPDSAAWRLHIGDVIIERSGIGVWGDGPRICDMETADYHPDLPTAAAAVCARLGIASVEVGDV